LDSVSVGISLLLWSQTKKRSKFIEFSLYDGAVFDMSYGFTDYLILHLAVRRVTVGAPKETKLRDVTGNILFKKH
jgi:hypothetical protein